MKSNKWIGKIITVLFISLLGASVALASPLSKAKADGLIGEQPSGYIGIVRQDAPADVKALVADVNAKRKAGYQKIAEKQGTGLSDVERVGGNTAIEKTLLGNYIRTADGAWRKK